MRVKFKSDNYSEEAYIAGISTIGEYQVLLPADFGHIIGEISVIDTAADQWYAPLKKISKQRYDELYTDRELASTGNMNLDVPRHFAIFAGQIYLGPVPDLTTYQFGINYTVEDSADVTTSTDPIPFTVELRHRNVLRNGVLFELHDGLENFEEASYYKSLFLDGLDDIVRMEATIKDDQVGACYSGF